MTATATILTPTFQTTVRLLNLDGSPWTWTGFLPGDATAPWAWIAEVVSQELECREDAVGCAEGPDGEDWITVDGVPVYICQIGRPKKVANIC